MIVLIHKGLESDSKQGIQRKLHSQVKALGPTEVRRAPFSGWLLGCPRREFACGRPEMELP